MSTDNQDQAWMGQLTQVTTGADHGGADVVSDREAVGDALGALAEKIPACQSLGDRLKQIGATAEERARVEAADKQARKEREAAEEVATVRAFFNAAWLQFTTNIAEGRLPGSITLGRRSHDKAHTLLGAYSWNLPWCQKWQAGGKGIWNQPSKFARMWTEFLVGCEENGLSPVWAYEHDGMGVESWWVLTVETLAEAPRTTVDAATGGIMDEIGVKLTRGGLEDASGARRLIHDALSQGNFAMAARMLGSDEVWARNLWHRHNVKS